MGNLFEQKYPNNVRTVSGLNNIPFQDDVVIEVDTTLGAASINLLDIPVSSGFGYWSTQYKLYIVDKSNNAGVNNITVNAPVGTKINGGASFTISSNGASLLVRVASNNNYVGQYSVIAGGTGNGHIIADEGVNLPQQPILDFVGEGVTVTNGVGKTIVTVGGGGGATVWNDIQNLNYYDYPLAKASGILPQYTIEGNKITLRGLLFVPLDGFATANFITNAYSYRDVGNAVLDTSGLNVSSVINANGNTLYGRQGIFLTGDTATRQNLPLIATPVARDINFTNVIATRRFVGGFGNPVVLYRSLVTLRICSLVTSASSSLGLGVGSLAMFSPFNEEFGGFNNSPLFANDPLALLISRATDGQPASDFISVTDDAPFTIPASVNVNPFTVNAHDINSLGGFFINLEGLTGYLN